MLFTISPVEYTTDSYSRLARILGRRSDLVWRRWLLGRLREFISLWKTPVERGRGIERRDGCRSLVWGRRRSLAESACGQGSQDALLAVTRLNALRA